MENRIVYLDEAITAAASPREAIGVSDWQAARTSVHQQLEADYPVWMGIVTAVTYLEKSDRYVVKFSPGGIDVSSAKVTTAVAEFLLQHNHGASSKPTVRAHMTEGQVDGVALVFLSRS